MALGRNLKKKLFDGIKQVYNCFLRYTAINTEIYDEIGQSIQQRGRTTKAEPIL